MKLSSLLTGTTPGPWRVTNAAYRYHSHDRHASAYWIVEGGSGLNGASGLRINGYFGEHNARLIASAPELAAALAAAYARIDELEKHR